MGTRADESEGPERSGGLPEVGVDCSYTDSQTAHHSVPHCPAALGRLGDMGAFLWETSSCLSLDPTEAKNGPGFECWFCHS